MRRILTLLAVLFSSAQGFAQQSVMSNDYWISFLPSTDNSAPIWLLASTNNEGTQVRVEYSEDGSVDQFVVSPNKPKEYRIKTDLNSDDKHQMAKPSISEKIEKRSVRVTSSHPISLQQFTDADNNVSLTLPIPTGFLGRKYVVMAYNDQPAGPTEIHSIPTAYIGTVPQTSGSFLIIATSDTTTVHLTLSARTFSGAHAGDVVTVSLNKGDTYYVKGLCDSASNDLTGSRIISDKPIAVLGGAEAMQGLDKVGLDNYFFYNDHIAEYLLPVEQWGTEFVGHPLANKTAYTDKPFGELYRVVAFDTTAITVNGVQQALGVRWDFPRVGDTFFITSEKPIMVAQFDYYVDFHVNSTAPRTSNSMQILTPRHQWVTRATFVTPKGYSQTYVYVTAHKDSIDKITALLPGKVNPVPIKGLRYVNAPTRYQGSYATYTLVLGTQGQSTIFGPCQFQVYNHGTRDNDAIVATYGYASSLGSTFGRMTSSDLLVTIDSSCGHFNISIQDTAADGDGIADVMLLDDPIRKYVSHNTRLNVAPHEVGARSISATVTIDNLLIDAFSAIMIRSRSGREKIVTFTYNAPKLTVSESLTFANVRYGDTVTGEMVVTNVNTIPFTIEDVRLSRPLQTSFAVTSVDPLPHVLQPGEQHRVTIAYSPNDTGIVDWDSIVVVSDCIAEPVRRIEGFGRIAIIFADDQDFKYVDVGETRTESITIRNLSQYIELVLTGYQLSDDEFRLDDAEASRFPITLARWGEPGDRTNITVVYEPINAGGDTALILWKSDIHSRFGDSNRKAWTYLVGHAELPLAVESGNTSSFSLTDGHRVALLQDESVIVVHISDILGSPISPDDFKREGRSVPSGVYFVHITTNQRTITQKLVR